MPKPISPGFSEVNVQGITHRTFSMELKTQTIQVAQDLAECQEMASSLALRPVTPIVVVAPLLLMLIVWWVVSASLAPVERVRRELSRREASNPCELSKVGLPDEIRPLVHELNLLFGRVRVAFDSQASFVSDASHELRSPLAARRADVAGASHAARNR